MNNLTLNDAILRKKVVKDVNYSIYVDVTSDKHFYSKTVVQFSAVKDKSTFIEFICKKFISAKLNGKSIKNYDGERLKLPNLAQKNTLEIDGVFNYSNSGEGFHQAFDNQDGERYLYTHFSNAYAKYVFACFDQPDIKAELNISVIGPKKWVIKSNYPELKTVNKKDSKIVFFSQTPKISTYLVEIFAGPYIERKTVHTLKSGRKINLGIFARKSLQKYFDYKELLEDTKKGLDFFGKVLGIEYPFEKYDQVFVPEFNMGAMENVGAVTITESFLFRSKPTEFNKDIRSMVIWHEMSHMWFGNLVTLKWWNDIWLNEAFANYMGFYALCKIRNDDSKWLTFTGREKSFAYRQDQLPSSHRMMMPVKSVSDSEFNYDSITYAKGASLLTQLVFYIGENKFLKGIHNYLVDFSYKNAEFSDILNALSKVTTKNLKNWRDKWLLTKGVSETYFDDNKIIQKPAKLSDKVNRPFSLNVQGFSRKNSKLIKTFSKNVEIKNKVTKFLVPKKSDIVLLNADDNNYVKVLYRKNSLEFLKENIFKFQDKKLRTVIWTSLFQCVKDGAMPVSEYLEIALKSLEKENISTIIASNVQNIIYSLSNYCSDPKKYYEKIVNVSLNALKKNVNNPDIRQNSILLLSKCGGYSSDFEKFVKIIIKKNTLSFEEKWQLVLPLAKVNKITKTELKELLKLDNSNLSKEYYYKCLSSNPDEKNNTWEKIATLKSSNFELRAMMQGFMNTDDKKLLTSYTKKYFSSLNKVWKVGTFETKSSFIDILYPSYDGNDSVKLTKEFLKTSKNSAMNRALKDNLALLQNALMVQSKKFNA